MMLSSNMINKQTKKQKKKTLRSSGEKWKTMRKEENEHDDDKLAVELFFQTSKREHSAGCGFSDLMTMDNINLFSNDDRAKDRPQCEQSWNRGLIIHRQQWNIIHFEPICHVPNSLTITISPCDDDHLEKENNKQSCMIDDKNGKKKQHNQQIDLMPSPYESLTKLILICTDKQAQKNSATQAEQTNVRISTPPIRG